MTRWTVILLPLVLLLGCNSVEQTPVDTGHYRTEIRWTSYGIPHIKADDWGSAGYGFAHAIATDAICVLADEFLTVRGERTLYLGSTEKNIASDAFYRGLLNDGRIAEYLDHGNPNVRAMNVGYVAGYNRYVLAHQNALPKECRDAAWVKPITIEDTVRIAIGVGIRYGLGRFLPAIVGAETSKTVVIAAPATPSFIDAEPGSNALAFGSDVTATGRGILLGNPHYPWHGGSRFHIAHVTIPGELDVMGVGLITTPNVAIGFNRDVAWSHTVSTALRFTLFRLNLAGPMKYRDGHRVRKIETITVEIPAKDGAVISRKIYQTHLGPVVVTEDTPWTDDHVYVLRDVNYENNRGGDQYYDLDRATSVEEVKAALGRHQGASFVNTIAADRHGKALYADMSSIPYVTEAQIKRCNTGPERVSGFRVIALNGSDPTCNWQTDRNSAVPGLMPPDRQPSLISTRYVGNSNDSYWLSNPDKRLEGYSPIIGDENTTRSLRTRAGLVFVEEILARGQKFTPSIVEDILFSHRHFGAELYLDDILTICGAEQKTLDVAAACGILHDWDRRMDVDSVGAQIYNELWGEISRKITDHDAVPFDVNDPVHTPRGLTIEEAGTRTFVMEGLEAALAKLGEAGVSPFSPWGDVQFAERNGERIGIPGGSGSAGMFSVIGARLNKETHGYNPIIAGNSYIQVVTWNEDGEPVANAILTYSQSPQSESPHYADQTRQYSMSNWIRLPFTNEEIEADLVDRIELESTE